MPMSVASAGKALCTPGLLQRLASTRVRSFDHDPEPSSLALSSMQCKDVYVCHSLAEREGGTERENVCAFVHIYIYICFPPPHVPALCA